MKTSNDRHGLGALTLGALGGVYGDIGTSPLYTMKEVFNPGDSRRRASQSGPEGWNCVASLGAGSLGPWQLHLDDRTPPASPRSPRDLDPPPLRLGGERLQRLRRRRLGM